MRRKKDFARGTIAPWKCSHDRAADCPKTIRSLRVIFIFLCALLTLGNAVLMQIRTLIAGNQPGGNELYVLMTKCA